MKNLKGMLKKVTGILVFGFLIQAGISGLAFAEKKNGEDFSPGEMCWGPAPGEPGSQVWGRCNVVCKGKEVIIHDGYGDCTGDWYPGDPVSKKPGKLIPNLFPSNRIPSKQVAPYPVKPNQFAPRMNTRPLNMLEAR